MISFFTEETYFLKSMLTLIFDLVHGDEGVQFISVLLDDELSWLHCLSRSSHQRCSMKKGVLRNFIKFTGKHLCQNLFFCSLRPATLLKKSLRCRCFPVNFAKFLGRPFLQNTSGRLLRFKNYTNSCAI